MLFRMVHWINGLVTSGDVVQRECEPGERKWELGIMYLNAGHSSHSGIRKSAHDLDIPRVARPVLRPHGYKNQVTSTVSYE
jgi:hypothetical protein